MKKYQTPGELLSTLWHLFGGQIETENPKSLTRMCVQFLYLIAEPNHNPLKKQAQRGKLFALDETASFGQNQGQDPCLLTSGAQLLPSANSVREVRQSSLVGEGSGKSVS